MGLRSVGGKAVHLEQELAGGVAVVHVDQAWGQGPAVLRDEGQLEGGAGPGGAGEGGGARLRGPGRLGIIEEAEDGADEVVRVGRGKGPGAGTSAGVRRVEPGAAEGHAAEAMASIERACLSPIELVDVDATHIPGPVRSYAYAFATWIALIDGVISPLEESTLHVLGYVLGISSRDRTRIQSAVEQACERGVLSPRAGFRFADYLRAFGARVGHEPRTDAAPQSIAPPSKDRP